VSIGGDWSKQLCAGTHVERTGRLGLVMVLGDASIGSCVQRFDGRVEEGGYTHAAKEAALVDQISQLVGARSEELPDRISNLLRKLKDAEKQLAEVRQAQLLAGAARLAEAATDIGGTRAVLQHVGDVGSADDLRTLVLDLRERLGNAGPAVVALTAVSGERPVVVVATNEPARAAGSRAGVRVRAAATALGDGGGAWGPRGRRGRPASGRAGSCVPRPPRSAVAVAARTTSRRAAARTRAPSIRRCGPSRTRSSVPDGTRTGVRLGVDVGSVR